MKTKWKVLIILLSTLSILSCSLLDIEPSYYKKRRDEHRFLRCNFNGEEWTYSFDGGGLFTGWTFPNLQSTFYKGYEGKDYFEIYALRQNDDNSRNEIINIIYENKLVVGKNSLHNKDYDIVYISNGEKGIYNHYYLDLGFDNFINIEEIDEENEIIKGTFQFRAITEDGKKVVEVKDGEFDLKIRKWRSDEHVVFKCEVDGKPWTIDPYRKDVGLTCTYKENSNSVELLAKGGFRDNNFAFKSLAGANELRTIDDNTPVFISYSDHKYNLDTTYDNLMIIDEINKDEEWLKGRFGFRAIYKTGTFADTVTVINGYFDTKCIFK